MLERVISLLAIKEKSVKYIQQTIFGANLLMIYLIMSKSSILSK